MRIGYGLFVHAFNKLGSCQKIEGPPHKKGDAFNALLPPPQLNALVAL
jgi:hypothetical protein